MCKLVLLAIGIVLAAGRAEAQPIVVTYDTLEARIARAEHVVVGTVATVAETVITQPGKRTADGVYATEGEYEYTLVLKIDERLKGNPKNEIKRLGVVRKLGRDKRYEEWRDAKTSIVWFIAPPLKADERGIWSTLRVGKSVPAEALYRQSGEPELFAMDFKPLMGEKAILDHARAYAKQSTKVLPTHRINLPTCAFGTSQNLRNPWNQFVVPIDPSLELLAKRLIASPQEFVVGGEKLDELARYQLRIGGAGSLRYFKAEANATLLRSLLGEPKTEVKDGYLESRSIRVRAFEILLEWGVETPLPKSPEEVTRIDLSGTAIADASLKPLAGLKNLESLDVRYTKITHEGLKALAGLTKLRLIQLDDELVTEATLRTLREMGMLHTLPLAASDRRDERPATDDEIVRIELYHIPLTDGGLKELTGLKNLADLRLQVARVTDAGLKELTHLPKLTTLYLLQMKLNDAGRKGIANLKGLTTLGLSGTKISDATFAELQRALPKCKIMR